ncbi:pyridine nucleotide-disulfide oxidoreductase [Streptomyces sulfonofaciens]|uniref:Pyridine nucleotide-disulfide oxidoreductase n=1 Tax=Streptomyces sulfonofaciens TaxID=68272 RepID=A0A919FSP4_9ACTN|nr:pyridine nucleotide-disulfide oxidoreductase [Streptomyces sulfonofaciens]
MVVVGAGPAGLAAADTALAAGADVTLVDSAERPGGQYHRMLPDAYGARAPEAVQHGYRSFERRVRRVLDHPRCSWWAGAEVWALERRDPGGAAPAAPAPSCPPPKVHVLAPAPGGGPRRRHVLEPDALVLATGAHDRVLPFPGWDLPGVCTAGAAQALAKGERVVVGDRVVVAGTGPFLLPVAVSLLEAGSTVVEVVEAGARARVARGWLGRPWELGAQAGKAGELLALTGVLARHRVPYRFGRAVVAARGDGRVEEVVTAAVRADWSVVPGTERAAAVDVVCVGHGFTPRLELPVAAGCALRPGPRGTSEVYVDVDDDQATSSPGVYACGEITGVAGAPAARTEGALAGWLAAGGAPRAGAVRALRRRRDQGRAFARRLAHAHPVGAAWPGWLRPDTVVCRCEETDYATVCAAAQDPTATEARAAKLATRAGLGPCQGRVCGPTIAELRHRHGTGQPPAGPTDPGSHHRPLAQPIRLGELARPPAPPAPDRPDLAHLPPEESGS